MFLLPELHFIWYNDLDFIVLEVISLLNEFFYQYLTNSMGYCCIVSVFYCHVEKPTCTCST